MAGLIKSLNITDAILSGFTVYGSYINNKTKQHSTLKADTFSKKNQLPRVSGRTRTHDTLHSRQSTLPAELSRVGLESTTLYTLDRALCQLNCLGWDSNP